MNDILKSGLWGKEQQNYYDNLSATDFKQPNTEADICEALVIVTPPFL